MSERAALFVRLPAQLATQLDARIDALGRTKQAVVTELLAAQLDGDPRDDEIMDLADVATMLRIFEADVVQRIADGDFPARRFGDQWRCSRAAVLAWLAGTDPVTSTPTGFSAS